MADNFMGFNQTLTFNGKAAGTDYCLISVDYSRDANVASIACAGSQDMSHVIGMRTNTATVNGTCHTTKMTELFGAGGTWLNDGATETDWAHAPEGAGAGNPNITSSVAKTGSVTWSVPSNDIVAFTATVHFDNLTVADL